MITVCVFALLPFLVIAGLLALVTLSLFAIALLGALVDADLDTDIDVGMDLTWAVRPYYRWLARHRGSPLLGVPVGLLLGGFLLWAALAVFVLAREARTTERLLQAQAVVENAYREAKRYPPPDGRGHFPVPDAVASSFANALGAQHRLLDAFGRPVRYEVKGRWKLASYRLRSLGFDGVRSDDDLCVSGQTRLQAMADAPECARRSG
ncbi:MAG: hypothetical protein JW940_33815 [Polyangiaceae bacterium]|nr:hypothetical protein [Polyangiaceae bacterium]